MLNASFDIRSQHKHRFINGRGAFDELTADHCIIFLRDLLVWTSHNSKSEFLARKIINLAQPFGSEPLGSTLEKWDEKHLARWLRFDANAVCSQRGAWRIAESLAKHCRKVIGEDCGDLAKIVNAQHPGLEAFARALVEAVDEKAIPAWTKPYGYEPRIDSSFNAAPRSFDDDSLKAIAKEVRGHLQEVAGPRVAVVRGTTHSGKKVVLRHLIKHCEPKRSLLLKNGVSIPILALALDEHDQQSFVDAVYRFFASARYREAEIERRSLELDGEAKLSRIAAMAREVPACVVLADIAMIEEDEIVRSLAGSHATELIVSLINGHRFTRVAFTTKLASDLGDASLEASLRCEHARTFRVPAKLDLAEVLRALHLPGAEVT
ncbi:hypothetical protein MKK75_06800 [Methylobacterium sp. J-030]|uniref:hypothetical protein n=1 Tax=Methylobacterium sp. J-030 TaxID=2836627 RepID=UPI001FBA5FC0|nr:hypothetical protein [Methylobacterium sp. J-030]MCJ2068514.1 hypothetical protein [Methylobacterium sp. J-030]